MFSYDFSVCNIKGSTDDGLSNDVYLINKNDVSGKTRVQVNSDRLFSVLPVKSSNVFSTDDRLASASIHKNKLNDFREDSFNNSHPTLAQSFLSDENVVLANYSSNIHSDSYENIVEDATDISGIFTPLSNNTTVQDENNTARIIIPPKCSLQELRLGNINRIILAHININSIRNKHDMLFDLIKGKVDILLITETKIDDTFPTSQFIVPGYTTPYRFNRSQFGGGLLMYIRDDIPSRHLKCNLLATDLEILFIEINIYKTKWLIGGTYNPSTDNISKHCLFMGKYLDHYMQFYDNILLIGDFNAEPEHKEIVEFCDIYNLVNLVKQPTCFKSVHNPSCIDLILTNRPKMFMHTTVYETGLSDFHKMTLTVLKSYFKKQPPKCILYRDYRNFNPHFFRTELENTILLCGSDISNDEFVTLFMNIFNKHAPLKQKFVRANQVPYMNKELSIQVMIRSKLLNKYHKEKTYNSKVAYNKQRNVCTSLFRKAKRTYYSSLNINRITDNKKFWKTMKPFFSEKCVSKEKITLVEDNEIYEDDKRISEIFINFFSDAVKNLNIEVNTDILLDDQNEMDPINKAIKKYTNHPSILTIKAKCWNDTFTFNHITREQILEEIVLLNPNKVCPKDTIPPKIIKENSDIFVDMIFHDFNQSVDLGTFPTNLKLADIIPTHKKEERIYKVNYRPVSILSPLSKIYENLIYKPINRYIDSKLSNLQCGFRKGFNAQHCLIVMLEKWRTCVDKRGKAGVLLSDLSKAFDCLIHDLLIAKLHAYGFDNNSLKLIYSYLTNRQQRVNINSSYSSWREIQYGVPQGSILGPLLFNIYLSDLFLFFHDTNIANYADDNSPYACELDSKSVIEKVESDAKILINWVSHNALKANADKFHLLLSDPNPNISVTVDHYQIPNSKSQKLLGITIDNKLLFNEHVSNLCRKASQKLHALSRVSRYMNTKKRRTLMKAFITSQFSYCPLVWMFHNRTLNNRINRIHERALRLAYEDNESSFETLLIRDRSVTIHVRNIQILAVEMYKFINGLSPEILNEIFSLKESNLYNSRFPFQTNNVRSTLYGTETLKFLGPKIWDLLPIDLKEMKSLPEFKFKIKSWKPNNCPCRLCKHYVSGLGFIDIVGE